MNFTLNVQEVKAPASGGYLIIGDDVLLSHCMVKNFNKSMVSSASVKELIHHFLALLSLAAQLRRR